MRVQYLQHVPYEPPGAIADWARDRGYELKGTHLYEDESLPPADDFDILVVMGGPMSVHDTDEYPWLKEEKALVREAVSSDRSIVGVCLGAQILAEALGASVYEHEHREVGWFLVEREDTEESFAFPEEFVAFHWHGDTFDLPDDATLLASTEACENQAFVYENCLGLQFHLESTPETVRSLLDASEDPVPDNYVQGRDAVLDGIDNCETTNQLVYDILDALVERQ